MPSKKDPKTVCQVVCFNAAKVSKIKKRIHTVEKVNAIAAIFQALSDATRMKIILSLRESELCVCDISQVLGMSLSAVSHQLRVLRNLRLVKYRNEGRMVFYSLNDSHVVNLIDDVIEHSLHS